jgi:hypothetical protein
VYICNSPVVFVDLNARQRPSRPFLAVVSAASLHHESKIALETATCTYESLDGASDFMRWYQRLHDIEKAASPLRQQL